jgi:hypothetical protein
VTLSTRSRSAACPASARARTPRSRRSSRRTAGTAITMTARNHGPPARGRKDHAHGHGREDQQPDRDLQQHVDRQRREAAADASQRELQRPAPASRAKLIVVPSPALSVHWVQKGKRTGRASRPGRGVPGRNISALSTGDLRELAYLPPDAADLATAREDPSSRPCRLPESTPRPRPQPGLRRPPPRARQRALPPYPRFRRRFARRGATPRPPSPSSPWALAGAVLAATSPGFERFVLGGGCSTIERREMWTHSILPMKPLASAGITPTTCRCRSHASGIVGGLGTLHHGDERPAARRARHGVSAPG